MTLPDLDKAVAILNGLLHHVQRTHGETHDSVAIILLAKGVAQREVDDMRARRNPAISQLPGNTTKYPAGWSTQTANT